MPRRPVFLGAFAVLVALSLGAAADTPRIPFQIATGSTTGTFFPVGEAIAGIVSHPMGVARCDTAGVCGPAGLIATARTSEGTVDNLLSVNTGESESGLAQSDVVAAAVKGEGPFKAKGKQSHVRVIASLFREDVHLVAAANSTIKSVTDLKGRRVALGSPGSGVGLTAREILAAYGVPETRIRQSSLDAASAMAQIKQGKLDAFFAVAGVPMDGLGDLLSSHVVRLVPIMGAGRDRLVKSQPALAPAVISYPGQAPVGTVSTRALWIVRDSVSDALVYGIARALFSPANHDVLAASHPSAREIELATAASAPPAPLHPGAARFYAEAARSAQR